MRTPEQLPSIRAWKAELRLRPLHDGHVELMATLSKGKHKGSKRCSRCGDVVMSWRWPTDDKGRHSKHCGCRSRQTSCILCGRPIDLRVPTQGARKYCRQCIDPKTAKPYGWWSMPEFRSKRLAQKRRARERAAEAAGRMLRVRLHDAHVMARTLEVKRVARIAASLHCAHVWAWKKARQADAWRRRYRTDPEFRAAQCLRRQMRKKAQLERIEGAVRAWVKGRGGNWSVEELLGYTMGELLTHLRHQFRPGMTMDNYGKNGWHIDHIHPKKMFNLDSLEGVRAYWALPNLRPLWAGENMRKAARVEHLI